MHKLLIGGSLIVLWVFMANFTLFYIFITSLVFGLNLRKIVDWIDKNVFTNN